MKIFKTVCFFAALTYANASFVSLSENIIKDEKTNYLWQDSPDVKTKTFTYEEGLSYCKNLTLDNQTRWEVPGFVEFFTIVNFKRYDPTLPNEFKHYVADNYWSTKKFGHGASGEAFVVYFKTGAFNREKMDKKFYIRCYKNPNK